MGSLRSKVRAAARHGLRRGAAGEGYGGDDSAWLGVDWLSMTRRVDVRGAVVNVVDTGEPEGASGALPLVLVHGLSGTWKNWLPTIPAFMGSRRVVVLDLPGFGESELPPSGEISITDYGRTVDALLDALGIPSAVVAGNSMGGFVACELALQFPRRVERLVLVSAAGLSIEHQRREPLLAFARLLAAQSERAVARAASVNRRIVRRRRLRRAALQFVVRHPEELSPRLTHELLGGANKPGFLPALRAMLDYSFRDRLGEVACPVLIVWGANDMLVPVDDASEFEQLIGQNARKVILDNTGHVAMIERPDRFNALVAEFIDEPPKPAPAGAGTAAVNT